ncbi:MAG TPA: RidA family protein [Candidatus Limnocylindria bacterium]|nr:RidA family protein [Candidatus Limnocylindria bacterium]
MAKLGIGRATKAGGMVYVNAVGPVDGEKQRVVRGGIKEHTRQSIANLKARLEEHGSSLDKVVWASYALRDPADFEIFNEEWRKEFPADGPIGQSTNMPPLQRRVGFRVAIGVIAEA